jgi:S1-C subfamily serine protease
MIRQLILSASGLACLLFPPYANALPVDVINHAQRATALVDVDTPEGHAFGSAFCIRDKSTFVTDGHVVATSSGKIKIVLRSGEKDQRILDGRVLGVDYEADLAVIQTDKPGTAEPLVLGNSDELVATQEVTAFGYPFGKSLALDKDSYPSITVNTGKVTSLRKEKGELRLIQVDVLVNPGNSGGPVLDAQGRVIGIVESGVPGAGLNFFTPVSLLKKMLQQPLVVIDPIVVDYPQRNAQRTFSIRVSSLAAASLTAAAPALAAVNYDVNFTITDPKGGNQTASGTTAAGKCDLQLVPMSDAAPIKINPFMDSPPVLKFSLTLTTPSKVVTTESGKIFLSNIPMDFGIAQGPGRKGKGKGNNPPAAQDHGVVNLLGMVDLQRDAVKGAWKMDHGGLLSDAGDTCRIEFPYQPPEEYDFRIVFTRTEGDNAVHQVCAANGRQFTWLMGASGDTVCRLDLVGGHEANDNPTTKKADKWLTNGQEYTSLVKVRKTGVEAYLNGKLISAWKTDYSDMSLHSHWVLKHNNVLGVGSYQSPTLFRTIEVTEITGEGKILAGKN